jgi:uncharacterized protein (TIGR02001 family)
MRKSILTLAVASALALPTLATAQTAAPAAAPASPHTITGNAGLVTDYRFRGISQTFGKPAFQGGFDYAHSSGFYLGNWNSNISSGAGFPMGNLEMDFYGGYKPTFGDFGLDIGTIYYYYPGTDATAANFAANPRTGAVKTGKIHNHEVYLGGSWKWVSLKYYQAISDYFGQPGTKNSNYWDLSANYDLGSGWGLVGHVGKFKLKGWTNASTNNADYTDWKLGVTKDISGWVFGASYITTNGKDSCSAGEYYCFGNSASGATSFKSAAKSTIVLSVLKSF